MACPPSRACGSSARLGVWVAAPAATALLADWGADVIKVEAPAGDPMRRVFGSIGIQDDLPNPAFALDNRGKRSVVLDLRQDAERAQLEQLLATADVFVTNLRPDALDKLDLGLCHRRAPSAARLLQRQRLRPARPGTQPAELRHRRLWARPGLSCQMADAEGNPLNARGGVGDHVTGLSALSGILAGVLEQRGHRPGSGGRGVAAADRRLCAGWDLGLQLALGKVAGAEPGTRTRRRS